MHTLRGHTGPVLSVCMSSDGQRVVSGSRDCTIRVWSVVTGACELTLDGHREWVKSVCMNEEGTRIYSGFQDSSMRVWDAVTGACLYTYTLHSHERMYSICVSNDCSKLVSGSRNDISRDDTVRVWDLLAVELHAAVKSGDGRAVTRLVREKRANVHAEDQVGIPRRVTLCAR